MGLKERINTNSIIKRVVHRILIPKGQAMPRWFVNALINPFFHKKMRKAKVRLSVRKDLFPFNKFLLGKQSVVESYSTLNNGVGDIVIGENTRVGISNVIIGPVMIGNNCILAQNVVISGLNHGYENPDVSIKDQKVKTKPIVIEDDCWIGANVTVAAGVTIGKHSVVGAGSTVTKSIPPYHVAVGNPAKLIKKYDIEKKEWIKYEGQHHHCELSCTKASGGVSEEHKGKCEMHL
ncbi:acyltransferase [Candidatus Roizmanbacteria bacterium]|nr:acyltransferase [Candidatus Roizmanbacteria bacterium]